MSIASPRQGRRGPSRSRRRSASPRAQPPGIFSIHWTGTGVRSLAGALARAWRARALPLAAWGCRETEMENLDPQAPRSWTWPLNDEKQTGQSPGQTHLPGVSPYVSEVRRHVCGEGGSCPSRTHLSTLQRGGGRTQSPPFRLQGHLLKEPGSPTPSGGGGNGVHVRSPIPCCV